MNLFQTQDFFKNLYKDKSVKFEFDQKCHSRYELIIVEGKLNPVHHLENDKIKVTVEDMDSVYVPISPHRQNFTTEEMLNFIEKSK